MRRRSVAIVGLLVLAVVGGLIWMVRPRGHARTAAKAGELDPWAGEDQSALIAKKRASRGDAPVDARPASLGGTVTRKADGGGVAGAVVTVQARQFGGAMFASASADESLEIVTDAAGAWTAPVVRPGAYVVSAAAAELLPATIDVDVGPGQARGDLALVLDGGGAAVSGIVEDIGGGGIAGARVTVRPSGLAALHSAAAYVAITGADGRYRLTLADGSWQATAGHPDYTEDAHSFELRGRPMKLDFELIPGGTIHGKVIARDTGAPVAGVQVAADGGHGGRDRDDDLGGGAGGATTDAAGEFTLRGVGSGALSLRARGRGYASKDPTVVDVGIGEELAGVRVMVERAFTISGFVVRKGHDGEGIAGVRVGTFSFGEADAGFALAPSAADGYFEIVGVRPARYMIAALGEGVMPELGQPVTVVDHDVTDVLITMDAGTTLSGRVTPPAVARLSLEVDIKEVGLGNMFELAKVALVNATSAATGEFTLRSVPAGKFTLRAQTADGRAGKLAVEVSGVDRTGLVVTLEERGAIAGRVVDAGGGAVAGVRVTAANVSRTGVLDLERGPGETVTADDGSFRVAGLEPGETRLSVSDGQGPLAWADPEAGEKLITITGAEEVRGVTLTVEARDGVIRGVVVGPDRVPAADVWVTARTTSSPWGERAAAMRAAREHERDDDDDDDGDGSGGGVTVEVKRSDEADHDDDDDDHGFGAGTTVLSGDDGRFTISGLRRGTYHLVADATKGGLRGQKEGVKTGDTVTLQLAPLASMTVVVSAGGRPVPAYDLDCDGPGDSIRRKVEAADGSVVLDRLPPGRYACDVRADGGTGSGKVEVATTARLAIELTGWASVTGVVVDEHGLPRPGLRVIASGAGADMGRGMEEMLTGGGITTDAAGRFEVGKLAAGTGTIMVFAGTGFTPLATEPITLVAGQRLDAGTITAPTHPDGDP